MRNTTTSRRGFLAGTAALPALSLAALATPTDDPIFAAIERHRQVSAAWTRHSKLEPRDGLKTEKYAAWEAASTELCHVNYEAEQNIIATTPTTKAGLLAYVEYINSDIAADIHLEAEEITAVLETVAAAIRSI